MTPKDYLVPAITTQEALASCLSQKIVLFAIENPLYSDILPHLDNSAFLAGYSLEIYSDRKILIAKRNRFPNRFSANRWHLIYPPLEWF